MAVSIANIDTSSTHRRVDFKQIWALIKAAASSWVDDYAPSMGAALSYYTLFSIAPLLLIVISVAGLVFGEEAARGEIFGQLNGFMGSEAAAAIQGLLESVNKPAQGTLATVVGVTLVLIGATTVFAELQDAMDRIWRAPARHQTNGLWALLRTRLLSFWDDTFDRVPADGVAGDGGDPGRAQSLVVAVFYRLGNRRSGY